MATIKHIIFDLDGTLYDSADGIQSAFREAYRIVFDTTTCSDIRPFIGPPIDQVLMHIRPDCTPDVCALFVSHFKRVYDAVGYTEGHLYEGVEDGLAKLQAAGIQLFISTNKRAVPTDLILDHFQLSSYFAAVYCPDRFEVPFDSKTDAVDHLINNYQLKRTETIFLGDTRHDFLAAENNNLTFVFASYGYGELVDQNFEISCFDDIHTTLE